jgi:OmcA/MtrC family decaheme c-type cytochrome
VPQDGIKTPSDFNATSNAYIKTLWKAGAPGFTGPDASGYYTATLTSVKIPATAVMLTGGVGYSYSLTSTPPLTQTNLAAYPVAANKTGGLIVIAPNQQLVATGYTGRRPVVEDARCDKCHQQLGAFTQDAFHGGQRNDATTCSWCHNPNRTSSGWSADSTYFIHAIHAAAKRTVPFTWNATSTTESFADIKFPGILKQCETCHLPGTYDFSSDASASALPFKQFRTVATGTFAPSTPLAQFELSPYVATGVNYGSGFSFNASTGVTTEAAGTTLVTSPIATACSACHDAPEARAHMTTNGGSLYTARSGSLAVIEQCTVCHGPGKIADIKVVHQ